MTNEATQPFSEADVISTADKLAEFAQTLNEREQAVLGHAILMAARAGQAQSEVSGYFTLIEMQAGLTNMSTLRQGLLLASAMADGSVRMQGALVPAVQTHGVLVPAVQ